MNDHFGIPEKEFKKLGVSIADCIKCLPLFGPSDEHPKYKGDFVQRPFSHINLMHYIDNCGQIFMISQKKVGDKIAKAMFDSYDSKKKVQIFSYIDWYEDGDEDE